MRLGFSTALLLDFHQSGVLQFPQGVHRFLPPTMEQVNHFADRVIQEKSVRSHPPTHSCGITLSGAG